MRTRFGEAMRLLRQEAGLSLHALAHRISWSKAAIGHAESGARKVSRELAAALDRELNADGLLITLAAADRDRPRILDDVQRRTLLMGVAASLASATESYTPQGRVGAFDLASLVERMEELRRLDDALGGADTFTLYAAEFERTKEMFGATTHSGATRRELLGLLSEQAQLAGWAAFDAGWHDRAEGLYAQSQSLAAEAEAPALYANALALTAYQRAFTGNPDPELAAASCEAASERTPAVVRALIFDRAAWTYAVAGRPYETERALGLVEAAVNDPDGSPAPHWAAWVDPLELDIITGRCWSVLRRPLRAVEPLKRALDVFPDEYSRDKALYTLALADAYTHAREFDLADQAITSAQDLIGGVASARPMTQLKRTLALSASVRGD